MNQINYQKELERIIAKIPEGVRPTLLLHSCCAPCSSYCMEYLREYFDITVFYYNPNISAFPEYQKRVEEEKRLIEAYNRQVDEWDEMQAERRRNEDAERVGAGGEAESVSEELVFQNGMKVTAKTGRIRIIEGNYIPEEFYKIARGLEQCPEGGERCFLCYELRLRKSFEVAIAGGFDFVTTTLTISPLKNAAKINEIGVKLEAECEDLQSAHQTRWLFSDFKKKNGYKRSIELSAEFDLYRQNYCGCAYSIRET